MLAQWVIRKFTVERRFTLWLHLWFFCRKTVETEDKLETTSQSVSLTSANASTNASAEVASTGTVKETESKEGSADDATSIINASSNESTVKSSKENESLKRPSVEEEDEEEEEVKPKKRKEDHNQSLKGILKKKNFIECVNFNSLMLNNLAKCIKNQTNFCFVFNL